MSKVIVETRRQELALPRLQGMWGLVFTACWLLATNFPVFAYENQATGTVSIRELLDVAERLNPEIHAAKARWEAVKARVPQVRLWGDPKIGVGLRNQIEPESRFAGEIGIMLSEEIPFPGKLTLMGKMAEREASSAYEEFRWTKLNVLKRLKTAFYEYLLIWETIGIVNETLITLKNFEKIAETLYSVGKGSQSDVLKAKVEISKLIERLKLLEESKGAIAEEINAIVAGVAVSPLKKPEMPVQTEFNFSLEDIDDIAAANSPVVLSLKRMAEATEYGVTLSKLHYLPDFMFSAGWWKSRMDKSSLWELDAGITLPIFFLFKQRYGVKEARSRAEAAAKMLQASKLEVSARIKQLYLRISTVGGLITLYKNEIIPKSTMSLESAIASYKVGRIDFLTLLDNLMTLLEYNIAFYEKYADYEKAIGEMEEVVGLTIDEMRERIVDSK